MLHLVDCYAVEGQSPAMADLPHLRKISLIRILFCFNYQTYVGIRGGKGSNATVVSSSKLSTRIGLSGEYALY